MQGSFPWTFPALSLSPGYNFPPGTQEPAVHHSTKIDKIKMEGEGPEDKLGNGCQGVKVKE